VNELLGVVVVVFVMRGVLTLQLSFCLHQILFKSDKLLDLLIDVLNLFVNVLDDAVMGDGSLSCR